MNQNKGSNTQQEKQPEKFNVFEVEGKNIEIEHSEEKTSSDAGLLLLNAVEKQIEIIDLICDCINDNRRQDKVKHDLVSILKQRVLQIAAGYEDANDSDSLKKDSILKICNDKLPNSDEDLASQPTVSRLESSISRTELYRIAEGFGYKFIDSYEEQPEVIILDCDDTNNNTYGDQQLTLFNNYYDSKCYQPLHIYEGLSGKLVTSILKPGKRSKNVEVFSILKRVIKFIRNYWPDTVIAIRGDSHFSSPELMEWTNNRHKVFYITGLAGNQRLNEYSKVTIESAENKFERINKPVTMYHTFPYQAESWEESQRVIVKVTVNSKGTDVRYIVTNLENFRTKSIYEQGYCQRGKMELNIKDHKTYLKSDRSSCHKFEANQFRLFLHSAAYVLIHTLQKELLQGTQFANATMKTIQLKLIKVAAHIEEIKTKIKIKLPKFFPHKEIYNKCLGIFACLT